MDSSDYELQVVIQSGGTRKQLSSSTARPCHLFDNWRVRPGEDRESSDIIDVAIVDLDDMF